MRSIGFDLPDDPAMTAALEAAGVLADLEEELSRRGMTGRDLQAVAFDHQHGRIELVTRREPLDSDYPELSAVLNEIARTCLTDAVAVDQFRRIVFAENLVTLELVDAGGAPQVYIYSILPETAEG